jgi:predicted metal-dependent hydrolase
MPGLLRRFVDAFAEPAPEPHVLLIDDQRVTVNFRKHNTAKRIVLRLARDSTGVVVTIPKRVSRARGLAFVEKSVPWISSQLKLRKPATVLGPGSAIPLRGVPHEVNAGGHRRGLISIDPAACAILVPGDPKHLPRRLKDWLKALAKAELAEASHRYAKAMNVKLGRISIRDQKSRWGSCSPAGDLSYSWRLILAPPQVLDYVAAHEVAHRLEMNHGPRFWRHVLTHCPHAGEAKRWFKAHGAGLHRISI